MKRNLYRRGGDERKGVSSAVVIVVVIIIAIAGVGSYFLLKGGEKAKAEMPTHLIGDYVRVRWHR